MALLIHDQLDEQTLACGGAEGINGDDLALRILLGQFLCGKATLLEGSAESGGEAQIQHVGTFSQDGIKSLAESLGVDGIGLGHMTVAHILIELLNGHIVVEIVLINVVKAESQAYATNTPFGEKGRDDVAGGVGKNYIIAHGGISF